MATADKFSFLGHRERRVGDLFDKTTSEPLFVISTPSGFGAYEETSTPRLIKRVNSTSSQLLTRMVNRGLGILCRTLTSLRLIYHSDMSSGESE
uniref:Uncharacterized protein n=1 Tax=Cucumis sativus TaxID=3659 RepID=A0A0A0KWH4_CUCSA